MNKEIIKQHIIYDIFYSPLGSLFLIFSKDLLAGISFRKPSGIFFKKGAAPENFIKELASYFQGSNSDFSQEINLLSGTEFERKVWAALNEIPFGETRTYKWIAEKIGNPAAVRAVGRALSKNPIPIVIPCHRVIESDGSIGGYSSGVNIKKRLLELEYYSKMTMNNGPKHGS
jgi:O-6-methylguanine DNA methyltransferase